MKLPEYCFFTARIALYIDQTTPKVLKPHVNVNIIGQNLTFWGPNLT